MKIGVAADDEGVWHECVGCDGVEARSGRVGRKRAAEREPMGAVVGFCPQGVGQNRQ